MTDSGLGFPDNSRPRASRRRRQPARLDVDHGEHRAVHPKISLC